MDTNIAKTIIRFPELNLLTRDSHKMRGYFGNLFKDESPLLHNHYDDGRNIYQYPLVQYKIIKGIPVLVGLNDGASLLEELFFRITSLNIDGRIYKIDSKNIEKQHENLFVSTNRYKYTFLTLWMGLNEKNYYEYVHAVEKEEKKDILKKVLTGNILSFYKGLGYRTEERIVTTPVLEITETNFKGQVMKAFKGGFYTNAIIPSYIGLGKSVSRGFGTVSDPLLIKTDKTNPALINTK